VAKKGASCIVPSGVEWGWGGQILRVGGGGHMGPREKNGKVSSLPRDNFEAESNNVTREKKEGRKSGKGKKAQWKGRTTGGAEGKGGNTQYQMTD